MSHLSPNYTAFIGSHASSFKVRAAPAACGPPVRRRSRFGKSWRCVLQPENAEKDAPYNPDADLQGGEHLDMASEGFEMQHTDGADLLGGGEPLQIEGAVSFADMDGLGAGLEEAFSKSLDNLDLFSKDLEFSSRSPADEVDDDDANIANDDDQERENEDNSDAEALKKDEKAEEDVNFLETSSSLESDDAVASINEAKTKTKKGGAKKTKTTAGKKTKASKVKKAKEGPKMTKQEMLNSLEWSKEPRWFFLQVKPGCEQSCAISIRNMAQSLEALEVKEVLVPATKIMRLTKGGQSVKKEERIFPGYILVLMVMNHQNYGDVQRVPNVQWFMGDPNREKASGQPFRPPLPVSDAEMKIVFDKVAEADSAKPEKKTDIRPGDAIEVLSGPFLGNRGRVLAVKPDLHIVSARLLMVGREAPVEFEIDQVKVVPELDEPELSGEQLEGSDPSSISADHPSSDSSQTSQHPAVKTGSRAGVASAADDLAALLSDNHLEPDNDTNLFGGDEGGFSFNGDDNRGAAKHRMRKGRISKAKAPGNNDDFSALFGDEDDDFSFLNEEGSGSMAQTSRTTAGSGTEKSSNDALISSDDEIASFLSQDSGSDPWNSSYEPESTSSFPPTKKPSQTEEKAEELDDMFDFLNSDDEFEEARIIPESEEGTQT